MARTTTQKITANTKTEITTGYHHYDSLSLTNVKSSGTVTISLWITSQVGSSITDTGTNSNESDNAATTSSVTLTVDGTAATADVLKMKKYGNLMVHYLVHVQLEIVIQRLYLEEVFLRH